jgi:hypothetical protein
MRRALLAISLLAATASVAAAHNTPYAWTVANANVMLPETVTVALPADLAASLESELTPLIERLRTELTRSRSAATGWRPARTPTTSAPRTRATAS